MKPYKYVLYPLVIAVSYGLVADFCHNKTKGFQLGKIRTQIDLGFAEQKDLSFKQQAEISAILNQNFSYLKKGRYCFVFVSEDQKYVIKLLQMNKITPSFWTRFSLVERLFPTLFSQEVERARAQREKNISSYTLAFEKLCHHSGTLCLHLAKTKNVFSSLSLIDPLGICHQLSADETVFILQEKAMPFCPHFLDLVKENKKEEIKDLLFQFAGLLAERASLGIADGDLSPRYNLGISKNKRLVTFDLDSLRHTKIPIGSTDFLAHMRKDAIKVMKWLESIDPTLALLLEQELEVFASKA